MLTVRFCEPHLPTPCALVLGGFDGLHLGHRALIERAKRSGLPVCITTMTGGKGKELFTYEERLFLFGQAHIETVCRIPFTPDVRTMSAQDFLSRLFGQFSAKLAVCGEDFRFGKDALGTPALLRTLSPCPVEVLPMVKSGCLREEKTDMRTRKISTSACKKHLLAGELALLNACLCTQGEDFLASAYFVGSKVEHGREVGRKYGFPTLNLMPSPEKLLPPDGVYGGVCATPLGNFPCIINFGARPTFGVEEKKIEAYLDGFSGDLYGEPVRVYPTQFFRPIEKFSSPEELQQQLQRDIARLRKAH